MVLFRQIGALHMNVGFVVVQWAGGEYDKLPCCDVQRGSIYYRLFVGQSDEFKIFATQAFLEPK